MDIPDIDPRGKGQSTLHLTPESIARTTHTMLDEILSKLDAEPGTVHATGALSHIRRCCRLLRGKVGPLGQTALLDIETAAPALYAQRTKYEARAALRTKIRDLCTDLRPTE